MGDIPFLSIFQNICTPVTLPGRVRESRYEAKGLRRKTLEPTSNLMQNQAVCSLLDNGGCAKTCNWNSIPNLCAPANSKQQREELEEYSSTRKSKSELDCQVFQQENSLEKTKSLRKEKGCVEPHRRSSAISYDASSPVPAAVQTQTSSRSPRRKAEVISHLSDSCFLSSDIAPLSSSQYDPTRLQALLSTLSPHFLPFPRSLATSFLIFQAR